MRRATFPGSPGSAMTEAVEGYLASCSRALWGISPARREEILRELRADLMEEAEFSANELEVTSSCAFLARRDPPERLAQALRAEIYRGHLHRILMALIPAGAVFGWILLAQSQIPADPTFSGRNAVIMIQAVGSLGLVLAQFLVRRIWAQQGEPMRLLLGTSLGFLAGILIHQVAWGSFNLIEGLPWAYIGFAHERMVVRRHWGVALVDAIGFAILVILVHRAYFLLPEQVSVPLPGGGFSAVSSRPAAETFPKNRMCLGLGTQMFLWAAFRFSDFMRRKRALATP
jgi:hypothetical protein